MKEWYLTTKNPNVTSGYEDDALSGYATSNFNDVLMTSFSDTVILCNYDLSERKPVKCIIQDNTSNTQLKSKERTILFSIGTVLAGMYVYFDGCYWLITGYPGNNKSYEKVTVVLCQYLLKWQNNNGDIIERWINEASAAKYDVGENGNNTIFLTSNTFTIMIPNDIESIELEGKRVFIDIRETNPTKVFKFTRNNDMEFHYGIHGGVLSFIADKVEFNSDTDNQELRICDYHPPSDHLPSDESGILIGNIVGSTNLVINRKKTYSVLFKDANDNPVDYKSVDYIWKISNISESLFQLSIFENEITIQIDNEDYIGASFLLQIISTNDNTVVAETDITITEIY
ncbi:hypothetical protein LJC58_03825 [Lachnospiraceae bacterium OttesenSCG-928-D06]|nr:hypothetical protein [Lachnospiraceae bacterium OttesenSCG-928-D06]